MKTFSTWLLFCWAHDTRDIKVARVRLYVQYRQHTSENAEKKFFYQFVSFQRTAAAEKNYNQTGPLTYSSKLNHEIEKESESTEIVISPVQTIFASPGPISVKILYYSPPDLKDEKVKYTEIVDSSSFTYFPPVKFREMC